MSLSRGSAVSRGLHHEKMEKFILVYSQETCCVPECVCVGLLSAAVKSCHTSHAVNSHTLGAGDFSTRFLWKSMLNVMVCECSCVCKCRCILSVHYSCRT